MCSGRLQGRLARATRQNHSSQGQDTCGYSEMAASHQTRVLLANRTDLVAVAGNICAVTVIGLAPL
jgi:hypothetical protein